MNLSSVYHRATNDMCYALDPERILIKIRTGYDVDGVAIYHNDPFSGGILGGDWQWSGSRVEACEMVELAQHKVWSIILTPDHKRSKYYFELKVQDQKILYFEDGFMDEAQTENKNLQCFTMPWLNPIDVNVVPEWVSKTIWYQIFPERFRRGDESLNPDIKLKWGSRKPSNEDVYGGDLQGIIDKVYYLKELGINGIYLNPIFKADSTHKYDTIDYYEIDPAFGDKATFKKLVEACHNLGIKVMLDGVFNHVGDKHPFWLDVLANGPESKYFDWFMINQWPLPEVVKDTRDNAYYSFAFISSMPKLNTNNPEVMAYISDICTYWIKEFDIDGWRFDVANEISHQVNRLIRQATKAIKPDIYLLGEIWHDSMDWLRGDEYDAVMNYPLTNAINDFWFNPALTNTDFKHLINNCYNRYMLQTNQVLFNLLDSHDTDRLFHRVKQNPDIFFQQLAILLTMAGSPSLYYGTELMLDGGNDPLCRNCMPWSKIDSGYYDETINKVRGLISLRLNNPACLSNKIEYITHKDPRVIQYIKDGSVKVSVNASQHSYPLVTSQILFANNYQNGLLMSGGVVIELLK